MLVNRLLAATFLSLIAFCAQAQSDLTRERGIHVDETRPLGLQDAIAQGFVDTKYSVDSLKNRHKHHVRAVRNVSPWVSLHR